MRALELIIVIWKWESLGYIRLMDTWWLHCRPRWRPQYVVHHCFYLLFCSLQERCCYKTLILSIHKPISYFSLTRGESRSVGIVSRYCTLRRLKEQKSRRENVRATVGEFGLLHQREIRRREMGRDSAGRCCRPDLFLYSSGLPGESDSTIVGQSHRGNIHASSSFTIDTVDIVVIVSTLSICGAQSPLVLFIFKKMIKSSLLFLLSLFVLFPRATLYILSIFDATPTSLR